MSNLLTTIRTVHRKKVIKKMVISGRHHTEHYSVSEREKGARIDVGAHNASGTHTHICVCSVVLIICCTHTHICVCTTIDQHDTTID